MSYIPGTPVLDDDLIAGAAAYLYTLPDVLNVLGADADGTPLLYQNRLYRVIESTQSIAAVLAPAGGWSGPGPNKTARFPRISLELTADPLRDAGNNIIDFDEVNRRLNAAYLVIDAHLHRPQGGVQWWGSVRTIGCERLGEPVLYPLLGGGGVVRHQTFYGVQQA